jgi:hypothetical protein
MRVHCARCGVACRDVKRLLLFVTLSLVTIVSGTASASAESSPTIRTLAVVAGDELDIGWQLVLAAQQVRGRSDKVDMYGAGLSATEVRVTLMVRASVPGQVWFADNLYGATAWARSGLHWRRVDTADVRLMIALSLSAGGRATVSLPLAGQYKRVRVLVRTPEDGLGVWTDVRRGMAG